MKQTIEIEVPDGKKAVWKDNKVVFEDIKPQLPKTWKEFCEQNNIKKNEYYLDPSSCVIVIGDGKRGSSSDRNLLPSKEAAEAHLALMQLHQLRDCYRQGWIPNWKDDTNKYVLKNYYHLTTKSIEPKIINGVGKCAFLAFPTFKLAEEFLNNFRDLIEQAGDLI